MRDASLDVDDPDVSMTDPVWHKLDIYSRSHATTGPTHSIKVEGDGLSFMQGVFSAFSLRRLVKPTMKGLWVPIKINRGANLIFRLPELIGLRNCSPMIGGKLLIASKKLRSFELIPITVANELDISECESLLDLLMLPNITTTLTINYQQLKFNLKSIFNACSSSCTVKLPSSSDKTLENIINAGLLRKGSQQMNERQALLQLQTDLIDHDYEEYSNI